MEKIIDKKEVFKKRGYLNNAWNCFIISNSYKKEAYILSYDHFDGVCFDKPTKISYNNIFGEQNKEKDLKVYGKRTESKSEFVAVYKKSDYIKWINEEIDEMQEVGYTDLYVGEYIYLIDDVK